MLVMCLQVCWPVILALMLMSSPLFIQGFGECSDRGLTAFFRPFRT
ncbi:hypothetical protein M758_3G020400 [Ceratodon purpureus]|nr:hypothetical protein M758_3G020400 [Ceratodon purpureus]